MSKWRCPLCGIEYNSDGNKKRFTTDDPCTYESLTEEAGYMRFHCGNYDVTFLLSETIAYKDDSDDLRERLLNLVVEHLMHSKFCTANDRQRQWRFYYREGTSDVYDRDPEYVNLAQQLKSYPTQVVDIALRSLMNLSNKYPHYGDIIVLYWRDNRLTFEHERNNAHTFGIMRILEDLGYVKDPEAKDYYVITAAGWQKIDELRKEEKVVRQAFIAMIFREEAAPIREAFRQAIHEMGYQAVVLDEKEHNNQIVPEIFYEIKRSKFVVVDVTYPSYGAYYEAGYAQALDKEVIICCREDVFADAHGAPHFDISQKSIIVWKDEADLVRRLKRRIEATVT